MKALMVAFAFVLPYHVLRTATAAGARVHVLGSGASRGLRGSRHCASYTRSEATGAGGDDADILCDEIAQAVARHGIDIVFPSDDVSTRLLASIRDRLPVRTSPLPEVATFDLLNDKGSFTRFALDHGIRVPQGWSYDTAEALRRDIDEGRLSLPVTVKPTNRSGGIGVIHVRDDCELGQLDAIDYAPILVQRHIRGETIGISVLCRFGQVLAHATQRRDDYRFELFANPDLVRNVEKLVAATGLSGPANLDAIVEEETGLSYIVECNPRFWYSIFMAMVAGLNFFDFIVGKGAYQPGAVTLSDVAVRLSPRQIVQSGLRASRLDWRMLGYYFSDPLPYLFERRRTFDDREVAVQVEQMRGYDPAPAPAPAPANPSPVLVG